MNNKRTIDTIIDTLRNTWTNNPDMTFSQLINVIFIRSNINNNTSDDELLEAILEFNKSKK